MRLTDNSYFPYPVLSHFTDDYYTGEFDVEFIIDENTETGELSLTYQVQITDAFDIETLVRSNRATIGCFIVCSETYFNEFRTLSWPTGRIDFVPGTLLNRVTIRPVIFANENIDNWDTGTINKEFSPPVVLRKNDLIALGEEQIFSVGQAKLADIESIFELNYSDAVADSLIEVNPVGDRITITTSKETFSNIELLRRQTQGAPAVMGSVYLPAVMETLSVIVNEPEQYQGYRWYTPFIARCDAIGVNIEDPNLSILEGAQMLLEYPIGQLDIIANSGEEE